MGDRLARRILSGASLVCLLAAPALWAGGTQVTIADAVWDFEEDQAGAIVGESVSATGDFNNDGYADVVVGARFFNSGLTRSGRVWVFYGSADGPSVTPDLTINPPQLAAHGYFGQVVATVNADGDDYDDLLVGMPNYDVNPGWDEGAVFLYYGSGTGLDGTYDWRAAGGHHHRSPSLRRLQRLAADHQPRLRLHGFDQSASRRHDRRQRRLVCNGRSMHTER